MSETWRPDEETPFRILVLADLSGRANRGLRAAGRDLAKRRPVRIDRDGVDGGPGGLGAALRIDGDALEFAEIEDFRPEALLHRAASLAPLRDLRRRLGDPATAHDAAEEVRRWDGAAPAPSAATAREEPPAEGAALLAEALEAAQARRTDDDEAQRLVREVARPGIEKLRVPKGPPDAAALMARVDEKIAQRLRALLRHPDFRALEAAWRGVLALVRRADLSPSLQLHLLDVSREEVFADVGVSGPLDASGLHRILVEETVGVPGAKPWTLVVADAAFAPAARDVAALLRLTRIVRAAGAALVAGAAPSALGCRSLADTPDPEDWNEAVDATGEELWSALRRTAEASSVALLWPRVLRRAPYGAKTDRVEGVSFEENADRSRGDRELWGNAAFDAAAALARAFAESGWDLGESFESEVGDLPAATDDDGDLVPCAEAWLTTRAADRIASRGIVPVLSVRDAAAVRLGSLESMADPRRPLAGPWTRFSRR